MSHEHDDAPPSAAIQNRFALERDKAVLLVIDVQEKLGGAMEKAQFERLVKNTRILVDGAKELGIPIIASEQYPKGLGPTVAAVREALPADAPPVEKVAFSCGAVKEVARRLFVSGRRQVVIAGM